MLFRSSGAEAMRQKAVYVCLAVFSLLFLLVQWHPQWLILLTPFLILSTWQAQNRTPWLVMNGIYCAGFFLLMALSLIHICRRAMPKCWSPPPGKARLR